MSDKVIHGLYFILSTKDIINAYLLIVHKI